MNELKIKNGLIVDGAINASAITSSLYGTASVAISASWAPSADSASWASSSISSSFATAAGTASVATTASFAITSVSSSFAITASYVASVGSATSASYASTASVLNGFNFETSSSISAAPLTNNIIISKSTGSLIAAFFDYAVASGSNIRAGTVFGSWVNGTATYAEYTTIDVGDTSEVTMSITIAGSNVKLVSNAANSVSWSVKAIARYL